MLPLTRSTIGLDKPSTGRHHHRNSPKCCNDPLTSQHILSGRSQVVIDVSRLGLASLAAWPRLWSWWSDRVAGTEIAEVRFVPAVVLGEPPRVMRRL